MKTSTVHYALAVAAFFAPGWAWAATDGASQPAAQSARNMPSGPARDCAAFVRTANLTRLPEAPTQILTARPVEAKGGVPAYCSVKGVIYPNVGFEIKLPAANWNGRFFAVGCGNYCGIIYPTACDDPLQRGYACIANDSGHVARPEDVDWTDGRWAYDNLQAELDWGGRAIHVAAVSGKAITEAYYGAAPGKSYFMGCSYGGQQAMVLAQRFPWDFDGIVGGGAPNSISGLMQQNAWALTHGFDQNFKSLFSDADIRVLHGYVLSHCDMDDGIKDGLVSNPRACKVNVDELACRAGQNTECLSRDAIAAAKDMYAGPSDSRGRRVSPGGWEPGTEVFWQHVYRPDGTGLAALAENYFRFMGRYPDIGPSWSPRDYDFDRDYKRNDVMETVYAAAHPDLRRFKDNGGKFINYVGYADLGTIPATAIDYYETMQRTMGGPPQTADFFRMFMIPGALHCRGGQGPHKVDFISYIENWVERGQAPGMMVGTHPKDEWGGDFTRPLYPYPNIPRYNGSGDPTDYRSFKEVAVRR